VPRALATVTSERGARASPAAAHRWAALLCAAAHRHPVQVASQVATGAGYFRFRFFLRACFSALRLSACFALSAGRVAPSRLLVPGGL
jgi:hypothetical protein